LPSLTIAYKSIGRDNGVSVDSTGSVDNETNTINFSTGYNFRLADYKTTVSFNFSKTEKADNADTSGIKDTESNTIGFSLKTNLSSNLAALVSYTNTNNKAINNFNDIKSSTFGIRVEYKLLNRRLSTFGSFQSNSTTGDQVFDFDLTTGVIVPLTKEIDLSSITLKAGASLKISRAQKLRGDLTIRSFGGQSDAGSDVRLVARYEVSF